MYNKEKAIEEIISVCKKLHTKNFLASADGNVSVRLSDDQILLTPSGVAKCDVNSEEMAIVNLSGDILQGKPSSEKLMHLEVYRNCPKAKAVVHAHPPHSIAWSIARPELTELPATAMSELILAVGSVPIVPYARPGSQAMGNNLLPFLPKNRVMILARHGALCWGESLSEAYNGMERVEHSAQILLLAEQLGGVTSLPEKEVAELLELRIKLGSKTL